MYSFITTSKNINWKLSALDRGKRKAVLLLQSHNLGSCRSHKRIQSEKLRFRWFHTSTHICTHTLALIYAHTHSQIYTCTHTHTHTCSHIRTHSHSNTQTHVYTHTHIYYTHTHTHKCAHTQTQLHSHANVHTHSSPLIIFHCNGAKAPMRYRRLKNGGEWREKSSEKVSSGKERISSKEVPPYAVASLAG